MSVRVAQLRCPSCGWPLEIGMTECPAGHPVYIQTFNSINDLPLPTVKRCLQTYRGSQESAAGNPGINKSIAFCCLKLKLYDQAAAAIEKAIADNFDDSELYFYAAVTLLKGKKAFVAPRNVIDQISEYIEAALAIEPKGIYYYFAAYIKYDYFERKHFRTSPDYRHYLSRARGGVSPADIVELFALLNVDNPFKS